MDISSFLSSYRRYIGMGFDLITVIKAVERANDVFSYVCGFGCVFGLPPLI